MYPTRRSWTLAALCVVVASLSVLFARPVVLLGAILLGSVLLARGYLFAYELERVARTLSVEQTPASTGVGTGESTPLSLVATLDLETQLAATVDVDAGIPVAAVADGPSSLRLEAGERRDEVTVDVAWPVAGRYRFDRPTVRVDDGFFTASFSTGERPTVTVEPHGPREIHVGEGGQQITSAYGEHTAERFGSGIEPAELREYVPGDTAGRIDWKTTARMGSPYVREYETETDRETLLVVDHRDTLATGPPGETKLAYLREVALAIASSAHRLGDPIGLLTVDEEGITSRLEPASSADHYGDIRRELLELEAATGPGEGTPDGGRDIPRTTAADVARRLDAVDDGDDAFSRTLRPFYADGARYHERLEGAPLYAALRTASVNARRRWAVLLTDDAGMDELRETVKLARANGADVTVAIAPTVLYEPGGLGDIERAYHRYREFEGRRRELARIDRVNALEVAPADRLGAVLADGTASGGGRR